MSGNPSRGIVDTNVPLLSTSSFVTVENRGPGAEDSGMTCLRSDDVGPWSGTLEIYTWNSLKSFGNCHTDDGMGREGIPTWVSECSMSVVTVGDEELE